VLLQGSHREKQCEPGVGACDPAVLRTVAAPQADGGQAEQTHRQSGKKHHHGQRDHEREAPAPGASSEINAAKLKAQHEEEPTRLEGSGHWCFAPGNWRISKVYMAINSLSYPLQIIALKKVRR
jgi:hypothetical protein